MKFYYSVRKTERDNVEIYYKIENNTPLYYFTKTVKKGNKRFKILPLLMKNNWPIVTKRIITVPEPTMKLDWIEVEEEEMLRYLRRGNPTDDARSSLFQVFGRNIFNLTLLEFEYFKSSFSNLGRLKSFYHAIKKECRESGIGFTYRNYKGKSVIITPGKIKKAMIELFGEDPQVVLFPKEKNNKKI